MTVAKFRSMLSQLWSEWRSISTWGLCSQLLLWTGSSYGTPDSDDHYNLHGIRSCLVASFLCSFTQILWQLLRAKPLKISTIDSLFSVVSNPFRLTYSDVFLRTPVLWLCAALHWCIPIAMIYPSGAIIVKPIPLNRTYNTTVPTFDPMNNKLFDNIAFYGNLQA